MRGARVAGGKGPRRLPRSGKKSLQEGSKGRAAAKQGSPPKVAGFFLVPEQVTRPLTALVAVRVGGSRSSLTTKALARLEEKGPRLLKVAGTGQEVWHTKEPPDRAQGKDSRKEKAPTVAC